mmetsp:Transcript_36336/g.79451  ORF Transcript_36336/g.79451 Transcript_36336/m.79451 type:complete len:205 (-) Transcript_36336:449-1063(-)
MSSMAAPKHFCCTRKSRTSSEISLPSSPPARNAASPTAKETLETLSRTAVSLSDSDCALTASQAVLGSLRRSIVIPYSHASGPSSTARSINSVEPALRPALISSSSSRIALAWSWPIHLSLSGLTQLHRRFHSRSRPIRDLMLEATMCGTVIPVASMRSFATIPTIHLPFLSPILSTFVRTIVYSAPVASEAFAISISRAESLW